MLPLRARVDLGALAVKGFPHSPKLQYCWNLTIRLFSVINRTFIEVGSYPSAEKQSVYSTAPADWAKSFFIIVSRSPLPTFNYSDSTVSDPSFLFLYRSAYGYSNTLIFITNTDIAPAFFLISFVNAIHKLSLPVHVCSADHRQLIIPSKTKTIFSLDLLYFSKTLSLTPIKHLFQSPLKSLMLTVRYLGQ